MSTEELSLSWVGTEAPYPAPNEPFVIKAREAQPSTPDRTNVVALDELIYFFNEPNCRTDRQSHTRGESGDNRWL